MSVPNTIDPATGGHPEHAAPCDLKVVEGVLRAPLPDQEGDQAGQGDGRQPQGQQLPCSGTAAKLMREHERRDEDDGQDPAQVVDRVRRLVDVSSARRSGPSRGPRRPAAA